MAATAVTAAPLSRSLDRTAAAPDAHIPNSRSPIRRLFAATMSFGDRVLAKIAFHNRPQYRAILRRAFAQVGEPDPSAEFVRAIRKFDPQGLGVWIIAEIGNQPRLADVCRQLIRSPGTGPPRAVARSLERALAGERVCWFGKSDGFVALTAESLIAAALAASMAAEELIRPEIKLPWDSTLAKLTFVANSVQATVAAHRRVFERPFIAGDSAARVVVQAVNVIRRAMNRTDLLAVDEQLAHEAARLALSFVHAGCAASQGILNEPASHPIKSAAELSREKLASMARTVDAVASRLELVLRTETVTATSSLIEHAEKVIAQIPDALGPWLIQFPKADVADSTASTAQLSRRAVEMSLASSDILESWAMLHELMVASTPTRDGTATTSCTSMLAWAPRLVAIITGRWRSHEIIDAVRQLSGIGENAVPAASCIAALPHGSRRLSRDLWNLIRHPDSSAVEKSLAFQLFLRLETFRAR